MKSSNFFFFFCLFFSAFFVCALNNEGVYAVGSNFSHDDEELPADSDTPSTLFLSKNNVDKEKKKDNKVGENSSTAVKTEHSAGNEPTSKKPTNLFEMFQMFLQNEGKKKLFENNGGGEGGVKGLLGSNGGGEGGMKGLFGGTEAEELKKLLQGGATTSSSTSSLPSLNDDYSSLINSIVLNLLPKPLESSAGSCKSVFINLYNLALKPVSMTGGSQLKFFEMIAKLETDMINAFLRQMKFEGRNDKDLIVPEFNGEIISVPDAQATTVALESPTYAEDRSELLKKQIIGDKLSDSETRLLNNVMQSGKYYFSVWKDVMLKYIKYFGKREINGGGELTDEKVPYSFLENSIARVKANISALSNKAVQIAAYQFASDILFLIAADKKIPEGDKLQIETVALMYLKEKDRLETEKEKVIYSDDNSDLLSLLKNGLSDDAAAFLGKESEGEKFGGKELGEEVLGGSELEEELEEEETIDLDATKISLK